LDSKEPEQVAKAAEMLGMKYIVITSVTRDDLPDQGALQFLATIQAVAKALPEAGIEALTPDFQGKTSLVELVAAAPVRVFAHNLETVPSLYPKVRPEAEFERSIGVLKAAKMASPLVLTKTGFMLGLGEKLPELFRALEAAKEAGVDMITLGQYLRPSMKQLPVERFLPPEAFQEIAKKAKALGFRSVVAGPLVRSSYRSWEALELAGRT
jgi:lipoic acid synthetase